MAGKPPKGEPWIWLTRELIGSESWRLLGINGRRFVDFLLLEHMSKGGAKNGELLAPYRQLAKFGVCDRRTTDAIREAEELGFVDCIRGGMRAATRYSLTWLATSDGQPPTNRWKNLPDKVKADQPKIQKSARQMSGRLPDKCQADGRNLPDKCQADGPENLPDKVKALIRDSYQGKKDGLAARSAVDDAVPRPATVIVGKFGGQS